MTTHSGAEGGSCQARVSLGNIIIISPLGGAPVVQELRLIDEFPFTFQGQTFVVGLANDRKLYLPLRPICQALGIDFASQRKRVLRNAAISDALTNLTFQNYPYSEEGGRRREASCLRLDRLPYWLGTIEASRIPDEGRRRAIVRFQREFADVAWLAFRSQILPGDMIAELDASLPAQVQLYHKAMDEAAEMRHGLQDHEGRIDRLEERMTGLEARLEGTDFINPEQGRRYQIMVSLLADVLGKKGKGSPHAQVHNEVKRAFKVPSYLLIPEARFTDVVRFLAGWYQRLTPPGTPLPTTFTLPDQKRML